MLRLLDIAFFIFHAALILFNVTGWAWRRTRRLNLACLLLTASSWFLMGIWHGAGYCVFTDWHFQVRHALGITDDPSNYVQLLVRTLTGWTPSDELSKNVAGVCFLVSLILSIGLNLRDRRQAAGSVVAAAD